MAEIPSALIQDATLVTNNSARSNALVSDDGGAACEGRFRYRTTGGGTSTLNLQVAASLDDSYQRESTGAVSPTSIYVWLDANSSSASRYHGGFRFESASLPPKGSTITVAYLEVYVWSASYADVKVDLHFEKAAAPAAFSTTAYDITGRSRTTEKVLWDATALGAGWKQSPSLVTPLQEIVDAYDATALVVIGKPYSDVNRYFDLRSYDHTTAPKNTWGAKLHIEWTSAGDWVETAWDAGSHETDDPFYADISGLDADTEYEFQAQLKNDAGESVWSTSEFFTTLATFTSPFPCFRR